LAHRKTRVCIAAAILFATSAVRGAVRNSESSLSIVSSDEPGTKLIVTGTVVDTQGRLLGGARLHVYQTDAGGSYTRERPTDEPHARLSGWLSTDAQGRFEFRTIRPGGYPKPVSLGGRERKIPAHIHIDVSAPAHAQRKLQAVFADDPRLADPYWKDWVNRNHYPVLAVHSVGDTEAATLEIVLQPSGP
jgi:protocatechuate 3,4-dioxygenase beta subunit